MLHYQCKKDPLTNQSTWYPPKCYFDENEYFDRRFRDPSLLSSAVRVSIFFCFLFFVLFCFVLFYFILFCFVFITAIPLSFQYFFSDCQLFFIKTFFFFPSFFFLLSPIIHQVMIPVEWQTTRTWGLIQGAQIYGMAGKK